ncbi:hypothetical protein Tco_0034873, partial [Tanacetum coccineum]
NKLLTRVLRIILVIVPDLPSDTYVLTMKMEILLEPASNKLLVVSSTPLPPLKRLDDVEPVSGQKTIKSTLRSKSTFKAKTLKGVMINEPPLAPAKGNKSS